MAKKTTSLFELLPSSKGAPPSDSSSSAEPAIKRKVVPLTNDPVHAVAPVPVSAQPSAIVERPRSSDNFYLITTVFLIFVIITGLACFKLGHDIGIRKGKEFGISERSKREMPSVGSTVVEPMAEREATGTSRSLMIPSSTLPSTVRDLTASQRRAITPVGERKRFTLRVVYFGRNNVAETNNLVTALKKKGLDAFGNTRSGEVFVGRFSKTKSNEVDVVRRKVVTFKWRNRTLSDPYMVNIPDNFIK